MTRATESSRSRRVAGTLRVPSAEFVTSVILSNYSPISSSKRNTAHVFFRVFSATVIAPT